MLARRCLMQYLRGNLKKIHIRSFAVVRQRLSDTRSQSFVLNDENKQDSLKRIDQKEPFLRKLANFVDDISRHFLPKEYPHSVGDGYMGFARGQFSASMFGSAGGVLAMQSLLYAVGLGTGSLPLAATVNWVLRDGLGQLGGVIFSSFAGSRFDADPKRWRMAAAIALEASALVELLTPLAPAYFLLIASVANIGKNISFLAASASRAAIHKSFAVSENLADVTAKTGSQTIFSSTLGTGLGISLATLIGNEYSLTVAAFVCLSSLSLLSTYYSIGHVTINTISVIRLECLLSHYLAIEKHLEKKDCHGVLSVLSTISSYSSTNSSSTAVYERQLLSPSEVRALERLLAVPTTSQSVLPPLSVGSDLNQAVRSSQQMEALLRVFSAEKYLINVLTATTGDGSTVTASETHLLFREGATLHDVVTGFTVAYIVRLLLMSEPGVNNNNNSSSSSRNSDGSSDNTSTTAASVAVNLIQRTDLLLRAKQIANTEVFPGITLCRSFADKLVVSEQSQWLASSGLLETRFARISSH